MPAWKAIKWRELVIFLKEAGFEGPYSGGKHQYLVKGELKLTIPNPHQADISIGLLSKIQNTLETNSSSFFEVAQDSIGAGEGPGDLSTNPDYMQA